MRLRINIRLGVGNLVESERTVRVVGGRALDRLSILVLAGELKAELRRVFQVAPGQALGAADDDFAVRVILIAEFQLVQAVGTLDGGGRLNLTAPILQGYRYRVHHTRVGVARFALIDFAYRVLVRTGMGCRINIRLGIGDFIKGKRSVGIVARLQREFALGGILRFQHKFKLLIFQLAAAQQLHAAQNQSALAVISVFEQRLIHGLGYAFFIHIGDDRLGRRDGAVTVVRQAYLDGVYHLGIGVTRLGSSHLLAHLIGDLALMGGRIHIRLGIHKGREGHIALRVVGGGQFLAGAHIGKHKLELSIFQRAPGQYLLGGQVQPALGLVGILEGNLRSVCRLDNRLGGLNVPRAVILQRYLDHVLSLRVGITVRSRVYLGYLVLVFARVLSVRVLLHIRLRIVQPEGELARRVVPGPPDLLILNLRRRGIVGLPAQHKLELLILQIPSGQVLGPFDYRRARGGVVVLKGDARLRILLAFHRVAGRGRDVALAVVLQGDLHLIHHFRVGVARFVLLLLRYRVLIRAGHGHRVDIFLRVLNLSKCEHAVRVIGGRALDRISILVLAGELKAELRRVFQVALGQALGAADDDLALGFILVGGVNLIDGHAIRVRFRRTIRHGFQHKGADRRAVDGKGLDIGTADLQAIFLITSSNARFLNDVVLVEVQIVVKASAFKVRKAIVVGGHGVHLFLAPICHRTRLDGFDFGVGVGAINGEYRALHRLFAHLFQLNQLQMAIAHQAQVLGQVVTLGRQIEALGTIGAVSVGLEVAVGLAVAVVGIKRPLVHSKVGRDSAIARKRFGHKVTFRNTAHNKLIVVAQDTLELIRIQVAIGICLFLRHPVLELGRIQSVKEVVAIAIRTHGLGSNGGAVSAILPQREGNARGSVKGRFISCHTAGVVIVRAVLKAVRILIHPDAVAQAHLFGEQNHLGGRALSVGIGGNVSNHASHRVVDRHLVVVVVQVRILLGRRIRLKHQRQRFAFLELNRLLIENNQESLGVRKTTALFPYAGIDSPI